MAIEKIKILGAVLELPAKQHCQFSLFTAKMSQVAFSEYTDFSKNAEIEVQIRPKVTMYNFLSNFLFQPPKLPLPNIELTLKRYLNAVETFTPPDQFSATSKLVQAQYILGQ